MPKSGRPAKENSTRIRAIIKKTITCNDGVSMNRTAFDLNISRQTVHKIVKCDFRLNSYRPCFFRSSPFYSYTGF
ncbi:unnamed protein product [Haemonchus placei]|uniref:HTH_Tnp_ISL3 domain-containing protein n=1 Tax=Haemonchus placei TaxID=6290 RepID=A0A0N4WNI3_HAEPC|nr:unnamed protein product [Haemonchus placei]